MTALDTPETDLLTEKDAAEQAGTHGEAIRNWAAMGLLEAVGTPEGVRYPLHGIRAVLAGDWLRVPAEQYMSPYYAGQELGAATSTLRLKAREGRLTRLRLPGGQFAYSAAEIRAIAAERERLGKPQWWPEPKLPD